jgi:hypothetical protein
MILVHAGQTSIPCVTMSIDDFGTLVQIGTEYLIDVCSVFTDAEHVPVSHETLMHALRELS